MAENKRNYLFDQSTDDSGKVYTPELFSKVTSSSKDGRLSSVAITPFMHIDPATGQAISEPKLSVRVYNRSGQGQQASNVKAYVNAGAFAAVMRQILNGTFQYANYNYKKDQNAPIQTAAVDFLGGVPGQEVRKVNITYSVDGTTGRASYTMTCAAPVDGRQQYSTAYIWPVDMMELAQRVTAWFDTSAAIWMGEFNSAWAAASAANPQGGSQQEAAPQYQQPVAPIQPVAPAAPVYQQPVAPIQPVAPAAPTYQQPVQQVQPVQPVAPVAQPVIPTAQQIPTAAPTTPTQIQAPSLNMQPQAPAAPQGSPEDFENLMSQTIQQ